MIYRVFTRFYTIYINYVVLRGRCGKGCLFHFPVYISSPESLFIGNNVKIGPFTTLLCQGSITIMDNVLIASNCVLSSTGHNLQVSSRSQETRGPIVIEQNVWIGASSTVLPNVRICQGSVVAAASVVSRDCPSSSRLLQRRTSVIDKIQ